MPGKIATPYAARHGAAYLRTGGSDSYRDADGTVGRSRDEARNVADALIIFYIYNNLYIKTCEIIW